MCHNHRMSCRAAVAIALVAVAATSAPAADRDWISGTGGNFFAEFIWSPPGEPNSGDNLTVDGFDNITIDLNRSNDASSAPNSLTFRDALDNILDLHDERLYVNDFNVGAGSFDNASLTVDGNAGFGDRVTVLNRTTVFEESSLTIRNNTRFDAGDLLINGDFDPGSVTVDQGSLLDANHVQVGGEEGDGELTVTGQSRLETASMQVGFDTPPDPFFGDFDPIGTVLIEDGTGSLTHYELDIDGQLTVLRGSVTLDGSGTNGRTQDLDIREGFTVRNNARMRVFDVASLGDPGRVSLLNVDGGTFEASHVYAGLNGAASIRVENGGELEAGALDLADFISSFSDTLHVTDSGSVADVDEMYMYGTDATTARVQQGGELNAFSGQVHIGRVRGLGPGSTGYPGISRLIIEDAGSELDAFNGTVTLGYHGSQHELTIHRQATARVGQFFQYDGHFLLDDANFSADEHTTARGDAIVTGNSFYGVDQVNLGGLDSDHYPGTAEMTIDGAQAAMDELWIGGMGNNAELNVTNGGQVTLWNGQTYVGHPDGTSPESGNGELTLRDAGTVFDTDTLVVGAEDGSPVNGLVTVLPDAQLDVDETLTVHETGTVQHWGGDISVGDVEFLGSTYDWLWGKLTINDGVILSPPKIDKLLASTGGELSYGQTLEMNSLSTFLAPFVVSGGELILNSGATNGHLIDLQAGKLSLLGYESSIAEWGPLGRIVDVGSDAELAFSGGFTVWSDGILRVHDRGDVTTNYESSSSNEGLIDLLGDLARLGVANLDNRGLIRGTGTIEFLSFTNSVEGEVRVREGDRMVFNSDFGDIDNHGTFYADGGVFDLPNIGDFNIYGDGPPGEEEDGTPEGHLILLNGAEFILQEGRLNNEGQVSVEDSILRTEQFSTDFGGVATFTGAENKVFGATFLDEDAIFTVSSGTTVKFFDKVDNDGEFVIGPTGRVILLDGLMGDGNFSGSGDVEVLGTFGPGNSPGEVGFGGDLDLAGLSDLIMEIAGLQQGVEYDFVDVGGQLTAGGTLTIELLDGFVPRPGDAFQLFDFASFDGQFIDIILPDLTGGSQWDTSALETSGLVTVVPEPATLALLGLGGLVIFRRRR